MKIKKVQLPKTYDDPFGNYPQYKGLPKVSYSQLTSFKDESYLGDYIANYFIGLPSEGNIFSEFGTSVGTYLEFKGQDKPDELKELIRRGLLPKDGDGKPFEKLNDEIIVYQEWEPDHLSLLSDEDLRILNNINLPENSKYEFEIVIDLRPFGVEAVLQGFIDRLTLDGKKATIIDYKTGNIKTKVDFYAGKEYKQTKIYAYAMDQLDYEIEYCGVELLSRKGNGMEKYPLKLEDKVENIPTPYVKEEVEKVLEEIAETVVDISDMYKSYNKIFSNK